MTFEQWWESYRENIDPRWESGAKLIAQFAWNDAVAIERERCAKLVEGFSTNQPGIGETFWGAALAVAIREGK